MLLAPGMLATGSPAGSGDMPDAVLAQRVTAMAQTVSRRAERRWPGLLAGSILMIDLPIYGTGTAWANDPHSRILGCGN
jgi:hypothetical protein